MNFALGFIVGWFASLVVVYIWLWKNERRSIDD